MSLVFIIVATNRPDIIEGENLIFNYAAGLKNIDSYGEKKCVVLKTFAVLHI